MRRTRGQVGTIAHGDLVLPCAWNGALHPELAKRTVMKDPKSPRQRLESMSALTLINGVRSGGGTRTPEGRKQKDFTLLDTYQNAAVAKAVASDWVDYLQLARWNGRWVIARSSPPPSMAPSPKHLARQEFMDVSETGERAFHHLINKSGRLLNFDNARLKSLPNAELYRLEGHGNE